MPRLRPCSSPTVSLLPQKPSYGSRPTSPIPTIPPKEADVAAKEPEEEEEEEEVFDLSVHHAEATEALSFFRSINGPLQDLSVVVHDTGIGKVLQSPKPAFDPIPPAASLPYGIRYDLGWLDETDCALHFEKCIKEVKNLLEKQLHKIKSYLHKKFVDTNYCINIGPVGDLPPPSRIPPLSKKLRSSIGGSGTGSSSISAGLN